MVTILVLVVTMALMIVIKVAMTLMDSVGGDDDFDDCCF